MCDKNNRIRFSRREKIYRQGYNAGCQDRKRHNVNPYKIVSNVSNVSNVNSYDSESNVSNVTPYDSAIVNNIPDNINNNNIYNIPGNNIQDNNILSGIKEEIKKEIPKEKNKKKVFPAKKIIKTEH